MHAYLITCGGTDESIPLKEVVHSTCSRPQVLGEIVIASNGFFYVEQKLGSYCRVSGAYLSHLVSTHDDCVKFEYQRPSAKRWPVSDTGVLRPDSPSLDSASCTSCASCTHVPYLVASGVSGDPCLHWVPSRHMQLSNPASHAS